jgi:uncharacterized protein (DUF1800 family)
MGDLNTVITEADVHHILGRTGYGPAAKDMKRAKHLPGLTRADAATYLLGLKRKTLKAKGNTPQEIHDKWMKHLTKGKTPLQDKTVMFFHDHFSVSLGIFDDIPEIAELHIRNHYEAALGNFKDYVKRINTDPAMMLFLNTNRNNKDIPNENYARELCELFTLGTHDLNGLPNYVQADVVQIARAFTGWRIDDDGVAFLQGGQHDTMAEFPARGPKILFDNAHGFPPGGASFTVGGEGANEIDEVTDILFAHTDSDGANTVARRTIYRMLEYFCYADPDKTIVDEVIADSSFDTTWDIAEAIRAMVHNDVFYATTEAQPFNASTKKSVKWPVDLVVGTIRMLKLKPQGKELVHRGGNYLTLYQHTLNMGQTIGNPPSVFGWGWEEAWISSSTLLARYTFIRDIADMRHSGRFKPEKLVDKNLTDPGEIADATIAALGLTDQFTTAEHDEFVDYLSDNGATLSLDLRDYDVRNTKLHGVFALVMQSPAFQTQ